MNQGAKDLGGATEEGRALGPDVQVFIPVFNDLDYFPEALTSVLRQRNVRYEVVVSDNASTDGTYEYAQRAAEQDQRIKLHHNDTNIGLIGNLNRFADLVSAPFYMILCSDDVLLSDSALQKAVEAMTHDSTVVSVYCDLEYIDGKSRHLGTRHFGRDGYFDGAKALRQSIAAQRNLFGIPLLNRTEVCGDLRYPQELTYTSDVYISALRQVGKPRQALSHSRAPDRKSLHRPQRDICAPRRNLAPVSAPNGSVRRRPHHAGVVDPWREPLLRAVRKNGLPVLGQDTIMTSFETEAGMADRSRRRVGPHSNA
jgi:hypothetical protein